MITCPAGHRNAEHDVFCRRCGLVLPDLYAGEEEDWTPDEEEALALYDAAEARTGERALLEDEDARDEGYRDHAHRREEWAFEAEEEP